MNARDGVIFAKLGVRILGYQLRTGGGRFFNHLSTCSTLGVYILIAELPLSHLLDVTL